MATYKWAVPYAVVSKIGSWSASAGSLPSAVSDLGAQTTVAGGPTTSVASTSAYISKDDTATQANAYVLFQVGKPTTSAGDRLWRVVPRMNVIAATTPAKYKVGTWGQMRGGSQLVTSNYWFQMGRSSWTGIAGSTTGAWFEGAIGVNPYALSAGGDYLYPSWNNTDVQHDLALYLGYGVALYDAVIHPSLNKTRFHEAGLRFEYTVKPTPGTVTVTGATNSNFPTFSWVFTDADSSLGGTQADFKVVVYKQTATVTGTPGEKNAASEDPVYVYQPAKPSTADATAPSHAVGLATGTSPLAYNVGYKVYVAVAKRMPNGVLVYGDFASPVTFTITATRPSAPSVSATWDSAHNEVDVVVQTAYNRLGAQNADFEYLTGSGDVGDWVAESNVSALINSTTQASSGIRSLRVTPAAAGTVLSRCGQKIGVEPGVSYYVKMDVRGTSASRTCRIGVRWYNAAGGTISTTYNTGVAHSTSAWTSLTYTATAPSLAVSASVLHEAQSTGSTTDYQYVDKVGWHNVSTTWAPGSDAAATTLVRSVDGGQTWTYVANGGVIDPMWGRYWVVDKGAPRPASCLYAAQSVIDSGALTLSTPWSDTASATTTNDGLWWLQVCDSRGVALVIRKALAANVATITTNDPHNYRVGDRIQVAGVGSPFDGLCTVLSTPSSTSFTYAKVNADVSAATTAGYCYPDMVLSGVKVTGLSNEVIENVGVFRPLNATRPVVIPGTIYGHDGELQMATTTQAEWELLDDVLLAQQPLILQDPMGGTKWIRIVDRSWTSEGSGSVLLRRVTARFVEVSEP